MAQEAEVMKAVVRLPAPVGGQRYVMRFWPRTISDNEKRPAQRGTGLDVRVAYACAGTVASVKALMSVSILCMFPSIQPLVMRSLMKPGSLPGMS